MIEARLSPDEPVWVGQSASLIVELKVPGFFSGTPAFDLPEVPGVILIPPRGRPLLDSETIDSTSYTVQRHELGVFVRRGGGQIIPAIPVRLGYKRSPLDREVIKATVTSEPIVLRVKTPVGAEGLGNIISARNLTATESWSSETNRFKVGDVLARTVRFVASDLPAIAFPEFPKTEVEGVSILGDEPELLETNERGESRSERTERLTYVFEREGRIAISGASFTWFDLSSEKLKTFRFAGRTLDVSANERLVPTDATSIKEPVSHDGVPWRSIVLFLMGGALLWIAAKVGWVHEILVSLGPYRPRHLAPLKPAGTATRAPKRGGLRPSG